MTQQRVAGIERPIIMTGESVRAILSGAKVQTRRVASDLNPTYVERYHADPAIGQFCKYGRRGDRLWVRERHAVLDMRPDTLDHDRSLRPVGGCRVAVTYQADGQSDLRFCSEVDWRESFDNDHVIWRSPIHMPRWASRITLEITDVRVERVQDISEADAKVEGVERVAEPEDCTTGDALLNAECGYFAPRSYVGGFRARWDSINAMRGYGWDVNPFVWVVGFRAIPDSATEARGEHAPSPPTPEQR